MRRANGFVMLVLFVVLVVNRGAANAANELDCFKWVDRISPVEPRSGLAMTYDIVRGVTVLFGGIGGNYKGDTWEWDGTEWSLRSTTGPTRRYRHAMAYDSVRGVTVLFGGFDGSYKGDTWEWNGTDWRCEVPLDPRLGGDTQ